MKNTETLAHFKNTICPTQFDAVIFDMDGVLTRTEKLHSQAWGKLFDEYLTHLNQEKKQEYRLFNHQEDYLTFLDGKARVDGIIGFLGSRGLTLPVGMPEDGPDELTVYGLGNRKNGYFNTLLEEKGLEVFETTVALIHKLKQVGVKVALISASKNCVMILKKTGLTTLFDAKVDGVDAEQLGIPGKPQPHVFLEAMRQLGASLDRTAIVEDAVSGVQAGKAGGFKLVIGVDRGHNAASLEANGAHWVVSDLGEVRVANPSESTDLCDVNVFEPEAEDAGFADANRDPWQLVYTSFDPERQRQRETLLALGNGYFVTRGAAAEAVDDGTHYPGTYFAGLYNRLITSVDGKLLDNEDLVNAPNWLALSFRCNESDWFDLRNVEILSYENRLDLKQGVLYRSVRFVNSAGEISRIQEKRLVHMRHFHLAALEFKITAENWSGSLHIRTALDGRIINNNVYRYQHLDKQHWIPQEACEDENGFLFLRTSTSQSRIEVVQAARHTLYQLDTREEPVHDSVLVEDKEAGYIAKTIHTRLEQGKTLVLEKLVSQFTSRDHAMTEAGYAAQLALKRAGSFASLMETQAQEWKHLWDLFDIKIQTRDDHHQTVSTELILHLHIFHLLQTVSVHSIQLDMGIPARGWHGEGYRGHIFWDDIFIFPFITLRMPALTRSLLKYRYRRLEQAKSQAISAGYQGAMFPWQSSSDGREETPIQFYNPRSGRWMPDNSYLQRHVNAAIAYNVWQYYQISGDSEFLVNYGAEMIFEIARFWSSIASYDPISDRYELKGVMGPDEYHDGYPGASQPGLNNNTYTNILTVWVLCRALDLLKIIPEPHRSQLIEKTGLNPEEIDRWEAISRKMKVVILDDGTISQFEGYDELEEFDWEGYREKYGSLYRLDLIMESEGKKTSSYKASKQADLLMLFFLFSAEELTELFKRLGYAFPEDSIPQNIEYYLNRTSHGSTLCRVAHTWVLSRSNRAHSWKLFREALLSDFADIQGGTTAEGIHLAAMSGTVDIVQRCYTGMVARNNVLWFNPSLPDLLDKLEFNLDYRQQMLKVELTHEYLKIKACREVETTIQIGYRDQVYALPGGETLSFDIAMT